MPNPTISIVTTVYDAKDYLPRTVRSILAQSFTDFELLLVAAPTAAASCVMSLPKPTRASGCSTRKTAARPPL